MTSETAFSPETATLLKQAGWYEGRSVNVDAVVEELKAYGYVIYPAVLDFLREFSGITLEISIPDSKYPHFIDFDPLFTAGMFTERVIPDIHARARRIIGHFPVPVGWIGTSPHDNLLLDGQGRCYSIDHNQSYMEFFGNTYVEAIENSLKWINGTCHYKRLYPYFEDRLYDLLSGDPVIGITGHSSDSPNHGAHGFAADRYLREAGYRVYTINPAPQEINDEPESDVYPSIAAVSEAIDILVYQRAENYPNLVHEAREAGIKILWASHDYADPDIQRDAENAGIEFIRGCRIEHAHRRLVVEKRHMPENWT